MLRTRLVGVRGVDMENWYKQGCSHQWFDVTVGDDDG